MPRTPRWTEGDLVDGLIVVRLSSWKYFHDYVRQEMLPYPQFVWRGQSHAAWKLESSLDRLLKGTVIAARPRKRRELLADFKLAARGRRGGNPPRLDSDDDWWALGQHNGLATPLLDWTRSPFAALYFAFNDPVQSSASSMRAVFAVDARYIEALARRKLARAKKRKARSSSSDKPEVYFFSPMSDENPRLVSQAGLFSSGPIGSDLESWLGKEAAGEENYRAIRIEIPNGDRADCLRALSRMNINHLTLFPDLYGACAHSNARARLSGL